jgi:hypothetical protein
VILCSTFELLFEFQNRIFFHEYFVRVSSCSNIKPFEVRGSKPFEVRGSTVCIYIYYDGNFKYAIRNADRQGPYNNLYIISGIPK